MRTIRTTTIITKLIPTSTCHRITTFSPLNPEPTSWTLLKFKPYRKLLKLPIIFTIYFILFAGLFYMIFTSTVKTIMSHTYWTVIIIETFLITEYCGTSCSWAPWYLFLILLYVDIEWKSFVFFFQLGIYKLMDIIYAHNFSTIWWTRNIDFFFIQQSLYMFFYATSMKNMATC